MGWHRNACHRSLPRRTDGLGISHSNRPPHSRLAHHSRDQDKELVSGEAATEEEEEAEEGRRTCGLCREARASPLGSEEDNSLLCLAEVDSPPPRVPLSVGFLISEHVCAFLRERKTLSLKSKRLNTNSMETPTTSNPFTHTVECQMYLP